MKKTNKKKLEEFIRVDHAGERGAIKIYEGQLLALNTFYKDEKLKKLIEDMKVHEEEHSEYFEKEIDKRNIKPTKFLKLWDLLGVGLGFGSTLCGIIKRIDRKLNTQPISSSNEIEALAKEVLWILILRIKM